MCVCACARVCACVSALARVCVVQGHPTHVGALSDRASLLRDWRGDWAGAEGLFRRALALAPRHLPSLRGCAQALALGGQAAAAEALFKKALLVRLGFGVWGLGFRVSRPPPRRRSSKRPCWSV